VHMGLMVWVWFGWDWTGYCSVSLFLDCLGSDAAGVVFYALLHWQLFDLESTSSGTGRWERETNGVLRSSLHDTPYV
jgi:hypothetical protein